MAPLTEHLQTLGHAILKLSQDPRVRHFPVVSADHHWAACIADVLQELGHATDECVVNIMSELAVTCRPVIDADVAGCVSNGVEDWAVANIRAGIRAFESAGRDA